MGRTKSGQTKPRQVERVATTKNSAFESQRKGFETQLDQKEKPFGKKDRTQKERVVGSGRRRRGRERKTEERVERSSRATQVAQVGETCGQRKRSEFVRVV